MVPFSFFVALIQQGNLITVSFVESSSIATSASLVAWLTVGVGGLDFSGRIQPKEEATMSTMYNVLTSYFDNRLTLFTEVTGKTIPSPFELETSKALVLAAMTATEQPTDNPLFKAVVAPTGGGKTVSTLGLMIHGIRTEPSFTGAIVVGTIEEAQELYQALKDILVKDSLDDQLAIFSSVHDIKAHRSVVAEFEYEKDVRVTDQFSDAQFSAARLVVCTHERWKNDVNGKRKAGYGVLKCKSTEADRSLIVVDEDPDLTTVAEGQPETVGLLASTLSGVILDGEARALGFVDSHPAVPHLRAIQERMQNVKDSERGKILETGFEFSDAERESVMGLTFDDLKERMGKADQHKLDEIRRALFFIQSAITGRFFYSRARESKFHAYGSSLPGQHRTIILDGTADLNTLYYLSGKVDYLTSKRPDYSKVQVIHVTPPPSFKGKTGMDHALKRRANALEYMKWVKGLVVENTNDGEEILVYGKKELIDKHQVHLDLEDQPSLGTTNTVNWCGRKVHFVHFGRGRGSNKWRHCTAYFRLGDFYLPKAVILSKLGSIQDIVFTVSQLDNLSSGTTKDENYCSARDSHLLICQKQDAARTCIRSFDPDGVANPARLYLVDSDYTLLATNLKRLFPGVGEMSRIGNKDAEAKMTGPQKLAVLLLETEKLVLDGKEIQELTGIGTKHVERTLESNTVEHVVRARGWRKVSRKAVGLPGKGYVLARK